MKLDYIIKIFNTICGDDITAETRKREIVFLRAIYFSIAKEYTSKTLKVIGGSVGRDHATVIYGLKLWENELSNIEMYQELRSLVLKRLGVIDDEVDKITVANFEQRLVDLETKYDKLNDILEQGFGLFLMIPDDKKEEFVNTRLKPYLSLVS